MQNFLDSGPLFIGTILPRFFCKLFTAQSVLLTDLSFVNLWVHYTPFYVLFLGLNRKPLCKSVQSMTYKEKIGIHNNNTDETNPENESPRFFLIKYPLRRRLRDRSDKRMPLQKNLTFAGASPFTRPADRQCTKNSDNAFFMKTFSTFCTSPRVPFQKYTEQTARGSWRRTSNRVSCKFGCPWE